MTDMTAKHAPDKPRSRADVWFVLIVTGGTSAILQMWHATHSGSTAGMVDVLVGLVPAATAIGLSHVVVSHRAAVWLRVVTVGVMLAFMAAAASASAAVVQPVEVRDFNWVFSFALDVAELACVWVLLGDSERKAAEASALEVARGEAGEARETARRTTARVAQLEADLAAANGALEALRSAAPEPLPKRSSRTAPKARKGAPGSADAQDLTAELRAIQMLDAHPELKQKGMAGELGRRLGLSPSYARKLHARLTVEERPEERSSGAPQERQEEESEERSS